MDSFLGIYQHTENDKKQNWMETLVTNIWNTLNTNKRREKEEEKNQELRTFF